MNHGSCELSLNEAQIEELSATPASIVANAERSTNPVSRASVAGPEPAPAAAPSPETAQAPPVLADLAENELARKIDEKCRAAACSADGVKTLASLALGNALEAGRLLIEARRRAPDGGWLEWLKTNCPEVSRATAYRYIELAERFPHVRNRQSAGSLRQAFLLCDILPTPAARKSAATKKLKEGALTPTDFMGHMKSLRAFFQSTAEQITSEKLDVAFVTEFSAEIFQLQQVLITIQRRLNGIETSEAADAKIPGDAADPDAKHGAGQQAETTRDASYGTGKLGRKRGSRSAGRPSSGNKRAAAERKA